MIHIVLPCQSPAALNQSSAVLQYFAQTHREGFPLLPASACTGHLGNLQATASTLQREIANAQRTG